MNERIKLLADQAEDYATAEYEKWIPTPDFSGIPNVRKIFNEKFSELIVKECMNVAMNSVYDDEPKEAWYLIKEHFGVEE